jgi:hypothetical protein
MLHLRWMMAHDSTIAFRAELNQLSVDIGAN